MSALVGIVSIVATVASLGYAIWRKYRSPEAQLARLQAEAAAAEAATKVEAERLQAAYTRIDKEPQTDEKNLVDRLNQPQP